MGGKYCVPRFPQNRKISLHFFLLSLFYSREQGFKKTTQKNAIQTRRRLAHVPCASLAVLQTSHKATPGKMWCLDQSLRPDPNSCLQSSWPCTGSLLLQLLGLTPGKGKISSSCLLTCAGYSTGLWPACLCTG